jgi:saccharopine dehydrogenase-like NADP-dependent oxidoreductase
MKIVVIGGSGRVGTKVVNNLRQRGHEVVAASPSTGVNTITGEGLADAPAGADVLRDEGLAYGRRLDSAGVDVTMVRYENLIHDYGLLNAISQVPAVRDALHQTAEMLKKYLK